MVVMIAKSLPYVPYFVHRGQLFASSTTILSTRGKASPSVLNRGIGALYSRLSKAVDDLFIGCGVVFFALHVLYFVLESLYIRRLVYVY